MYIENCPPCHPYTLLMTAIEPDHCLSALTYFFRSDNLLWSVWIWLYRYKITIFEKDFIVFGRNASYSYTFRKTILYDVLTCIYVSTIKRYVFIVFKKGCPIRQYIWAHVGNTVMLSQTKIYVFRKQLSLIHGLTHWGRVMHICVGKLTIIVSDNGLSPGRRQAIIWTNAGILLIRPLGTNFGEISIGIQTFSFKKMHLKMSSAKWHPFVSASMC